MDYSPWGAEDKMQQVDKRIGTEVATENRRFFQELGLGGAGLYHSVKCAVK